MKVNSKSGLKWLTRKKKQINYLCSFYFLLLFFNLAPQEPSLAQRSRRLRWRHRFRSNRAWQPFCQEANKHVWSEKMLIHSHTERGPQNYPRKTWWVIMIHGRSGFCLRWAKGLYFDFVLYLKQNYWNYSWHLVNIGDNGLNTVKWCVTFSQILRAVDVILVIKLAVLSLKLNTRFTFSRWYNSNVLFASARIKLYLFIKSVYLYLDLDFLFQPSLFLPIYNYHLKVLIVRQRV